MNKYLFGYQKLWMWENEIRKKNVTTQIWWLGSVGCAHRAIQQQCQHQQCRDPCDALYHTWILKASKKTLRMHLWYFLGTWLRPSQSAFPRLHPSESKPQFLQCSKTELFLSRSMGIWKVQNYFHIILSISAEKPWRNLSKYSFKSFCVCALWKS